MGPGEQRVADALVALAGSATAGSHDVPGLLWLLASWSDELLGAPSAAVTPAAGARHSSHSAGSRPAVARLELAAAGWGEGPGHDCHRDGAPLALSALTGEAAGVRWPRYSPAAVELGYTRAAAVPIRTGDTTHGALVLLGTGTTELTPEVLALAQSLADVAAIALDQKEARSDADTLVAQLEGALSSRVIIEQAKGIIATLTSVSMDAAFTVLRGYARRHRRPLTEVARYVVDGGTDVTKPAP